jgi:uncharacterized protein (DUF2252 family)
MLDINDLDETLPAPVECDMTRLAASGAIADHHLELRASDTARIVVNRVREYREGMQFASMRTLDV